MGGILGKKGGTFLLRTVRKDDFYDAKKPVLLLGVNSLTPLERPLNDIQRTAKGINASIAIVEQRYTGESLPTKEFSVETLRKFFTVPQSVQDVALVGQNIKSRLPGIRIILFGCSNGGTIAALARKYYQDVFDGAIVSSAPLKFQLEMPEDEHVVLSISFIPSVKYTEVVAKDFSNPALGGSRQCLTALEDAHSAIGKKLGSPEGRRQLEKTLDIHEMDLETREVQSVLTFNGVLTGIDLQSNDPLCEEEYCNIQKICKKFTEGGATPLDMLATIYKASKPRRDLAAGLKVLLAELKDEKNPGEYRMSDFHSCSSRGLLSTCDSAACPFFTRIGNTWVDYLTWLCQEGFGISKADILKGVEELRKYVDDFRSTSNILSINGDADPWYPSSISKEGEGPEVELVRGAPHCYWCDVYDETVSERIRNVIKKWLR
ncbi:Thymus-specific serine protease [Perkinsus chesapeaki]|uniref:Thymus-specific serine protease n=1 Tax=Perkinsus chesapeaki TaxID=330153 RepID=A0A7J6LK54_PERCH|nr:Thymus-specific serine protease [Perkinsus chesapeaki]